MRAILSVYDKTGLVDFARGLDGLGVQLYSTGGTKKSLDEAGIKVASISELTNFPEILDGRVKTLHPAVHGGILAKRDLPSHVEQMAANKISPIDLIVVNLYPFLQTISRDGVSLDEALENIDIGGPTMIRAAAKNFPHVLVAVDPADYTMVLDLLRGNKASVEERRKLAAKAFQHVAYYDNVVAHYLDRKENVFGDHITLGLRKVADLRYGENPHQKGAFYAEETFPVPPGLATAKQHNGPALSFNNILDLDSAANVVWDFDRPAIAIIKHNNSCGLATHSDLPEAYRRALTGDPIAAFGGVVGSNRHIDMAAAREIDKTHYDCIIAPSFSQEALTLLGRKKDFRIISLPGICAAQKPALDYRRGRGAMLVQTADAFTEQEFKPKQVTRRAPTPQEWRDLVFAWKAVKHIKSNAIVMAKDETLLGMGAGQPSRVVSVALALEKAGERARGSVIGSDAFFPFPDGVEKAARGGVTAILEPGGSVKDDEVIKVADSFNIAMLFTGIRHFKH